MYTKIKNKMSKKISHMLSKPVVINSNIFTYFSEDYYNKSKFTKSNIFKNTIL